MRTALEQVAELVQFKTGIALGQAHLPALAAALRRVDPGLDADAFLRARGDAELLDRLIDEVTVNETFFFRQRRELDAIDWPRVVDGARRARRDGARVWVAACASGEEAYTLAILASEALGSAAPVSILATDVSSGILEKARRGRYGKRATRFLPDDVRARYFAESPGGVTVGEPLRALVEFRRHNLVTEPPPAGPGSFDLIACRNVLIYFDRQTVQLVIDSLESGLAPGGMLLLGAADRLCGSASRTAELPAAAPRPRPAPEPRELRRPLGVEAAADGGAPAAALDDALRAANHGDLEVTVQVTDRLLEHDPLDADAYFVRALAQLEAGDPESAATSLRRALYVDPGFALAAFKLGRAHDERGDSTAAVRAYEQALRTLEPGDGRHEAILGEVDLGDVAEACTIRLRALRGAT